MVREKHVYFKNGRGQSLTGVFHFPQRETTPPLLIMAHGFTDDKVSDNRIFVTFARRACEEGYAVFRFDFAGSGESEGEFADVTVTREIEDLKSAIQYAHGVPCLEESPIYLIGYSLGGTVVLSAAAGDQRVRGVVCWAPATDLKTVFAAIVDKENLLDTNVNRAVACRNDAKQFYLKYGFFLDLDRHNPCLDIARVSPRPVLLVQGTADTKVLPGQAEELFKAAGDPKEIHLIHAAPHTFAFHEKDLFQTTLRSLNAWSRDAWYAADGPGCGPDGVRGRA
jgi:alpha-beta hydrolase superfamily lysophospholipase